MRQTALLLFILTIFQNMTLMAGESREITLEEAVEIALKNNPTLLQASENVKSNHADLISTYGAFLPSFSVNSKVYHQYKNGDSNSNDTFKRTSQAFDLYLQADMTVFDGLSNVASMRSAKLNEKASKISESWTEQSLIFEVTGRYFETLKSLKLVALEKKNLEQNSMQLKKIETFYKAGKVSVTDLYQQKAEMSKAEKQLLEAQETLKVNKLLLFQITGMSELIELNVVEPAKASEEFLSLPDTAFDFQKAVVGRDDLKIQELAVSSSRQDVTKAYSGYWPTVDMFANIGKVYSTDQDNVSGTVGLTLSIPLFDGLDTMMSVKKAKASQQIAELENRKLKTQAMVDLGEMIENYNTAVMYVEVARSQVEATSKALEAMEERYNMSASTLLELTTARTAYFEALYESISANYERIEKRLAVAYQKGDLMNVLEMLYEGDVQ